MENYNCEISLSGVAAKDNTKVRGAVLRIKLEYKNVRAFRSAVTLKKRRAKLLVLSIVGDVYYPRVGLGSCGQCIGEIREQWGHHPMVAELCDLWDQWHLNDMRAGTVNQMRILEVEDRDAPQMLTADDETPRANPRTDYLDWAYGVLGSAFLLFDRDYKFGNEWLFEPMPRKVVNRIKALALAINSTEGLGYSINRVESSPGKEVSCL